MAEPRKPTYEELCKMLLDIEGPDDASPATPEGLELLIKAGLLERRNNGYLDVTDIGEIVADGLRAGGEATEIHRILECE